MSDKDWNPQREATHAVGFARLHRDEQGRETIGPTRDVGAVFLNKTGQGLIRFDHTPKEDGVYFVRRLDAEHEADREPRRRDQERERE